MNNQLTWDDNCNNLIRKVNSRMQLIRGIQSFGATQEELVHLWKFFCRSVLEQSCIVWGPSLTQENSNNLERTQKTFAKLILKEKFKSYEQALMILDLDTLEKRRLELCLRFARNDIKTNKLNDLFPTNYKEHNMKTRIVKKYKVDFANTERYKKSSIVANILNQE